MDKKGYVYIMSNKKNGTLYVGMTSNLIKRVYEHKEGAIEGFTQRYELKVLVYYEECPSIESAIMREKQIKAGSRQKKIVLIESINKEWNDLYGGIIG